MEENSYSHIQQAPEPNPGAPPSIFKLPHSHIKSNHPATSTKKVAATSEAPQSYTKQPIQKPTSIPIKCCGRTHKKPVAMTVMPRRPHSCMPVMPKRPQSHNSKSLTSTLQGYPNNAAVVSNQPISHTYKAPLPQYPKKLPSPYPTNVTVVSAMSPKAYKHIPKRYSIAKKPYSHVYKVRQLYPTKSYNHILGAHGCLAAISLQPYSHNQKAYIHIPKPPQPHPKSVRSHLHKKAPTIFAKPHSQIHKASYPYPKITAAIPRRPTTHIQRARQPSSMCLAAQSKVPKATSICCSQKHKKPTAVHKKRPADVSKRPHIRIPAIQRGLKAIS